MYFGFDVVVVFFVYGSDVGGWGLCDFGVCFVFFGGCSIVFVLVCGIVWFFLCCFSGGFCGCGREDLWWGFYLGLRVYK